MLAWEDDADRPLLVIEDLSPGARWVPPWSEGDIDAVFATLAELAATAARSPSPASEDYGIPSWETVAADPAPFLRQGLPMRHGSSARFPS